MESSYSRLAWEQPCRNILMGSGRDLIVFRQWGDDGGRSPTYLERIGPHSDTGIPLSICCNDKIGT